MDNQQTAPVEVKNQKRAEEPKITSQLVGFTVVQGARAKLLTVEAEVGDEGTLSYQWYKKTDDSNTEGTPIEGATGPSYTPPTNQPGTFYYYVEVKNTNMHAMLGTEAVVTSDTAVVTVERRKDAGAPATGFTPREPNAFSVDPQQGRDIRFGQIRLWFPAGVWHEPFVITIYEAPLLPEQPEDGRVVSAAYDVVWQGAGNLLHDVTVTLPFHLEEADRDRYEIAMYRYDGERNAWIPLDEPVVNGEEQTVSGKTNELGRLVVIAKREAAAETVGGTGGGRLVA